MRRSTLWSGLGHKAPSRLRELAGCLVKDRVKCHIRCMAVAFAGCHTLPLQLLASAASDAGQS